MATTSFDQRHTNDLDGLFCIHIFGWLRSRELGRLMWSGDRFSRTRADRLLRGWQKRNLILLRKLPDGAGRAAVLAEAGARLLRESGEEDARTGKDWGTESGSRWQPDHDWKHDLMTAGVLSLLHEQGFEILTERTIRRKRSNLPKVPDGLAWNLASGLAYWLEVERAHKTGAAQKHLAQALCAVSDGVAPVIDGIQANKTLVAFADGSLDARGMRINHRLRVTAGIKREAKEDVQVEWCRCALSGNGVTSITILPDTIQADLPSRILGVLNAGGWKLDEEGVWKATYGKNTAMVWDDPLHGWSYCLEVGTASITDSKTKAMRGCAQLLSRQHWGEPE
jgi:hypothetical protein